MVNTMKQETIAVLDVGKTNKKVLIYDRQLNVLEIVKESFPEIEKDGLQHEQPEAVFAWFCDTLSQLTDKYSVKAISVTTHGATIACIDDQGNLSTPPLSYTNTTDPGFADEFYSTFGSRDHLQKTTATAEVGDLINAGKMVYFLKKNFPTEIDNTRWILSYPQYFGFKLTAVAGAEPTMLGCHSYLFDPYKLANSEVAEKLGISDKLPASINNSWENLGKVTAEIAAKTGVDENCVVTFGIHDSNASLIPYLISDTDKFILNSTGTWCVAMRPAEKVSFTDAEIGKLVFFNMDIFKNPVKTSIFMGGLEYETYMQILNEKFPSKELPDFNAEIYNSVVESCSEFVLPSVTKGTGIFPQSLPRVVDGDNVVGLEDLKSGKAAPAFMDDFERACAVLTLSLTIQTAKAFEYAGIEDGDAIFVEGGFRHNQPYLTLLKALYPNSRVCTTDIKEATALGSAICGLALLSNKRPDELTATVEIGAIDVESNPDLDITSYMDKFVALTEQ
jgi:L-fuculokinase